MSRNISLANLGAITRHGFLNFKAERRVAEEYVRTLQVKTPSINQRVIFLSGGNQQKVVLAKWLYTSCDILILDEPTRGIDVGAKAEIYHLINQLVDEGKSIILISSDMPELLAMSDRVMVVYNGRIKGELDGEDITADNVMSMILQKQEEENPCM